MSDLDLVIPSDIDLGLDGNITSLSKICYIADCVERITASCSDAELRAEAIGAKFGWLSNAVIRQVKAIAKDLLGLKDLIPTIERNIEGAAVAAKLASVSKEVRQEVFSRAGDGETIDMATLKEIVEYWKQIKKLEKIDKDAAKAEALKAGSLVHGEGGTQVSAYVSVELGQQLSRYVELDQSVNEALEDLYVRSQAKTEPIDQIAELRLENSRLSTQMHQHILLKCINWQELAIVCDYDPAQPREIEAVTARLSQILINTPAAEATQIKAHVESLYIRELTAEAAFGDLNDPDRTANQRGFFECIWAPKLLIAKVFAQGGAFSPAYCIAAVQYALERGTEDWREEAIGRIPAWILPYLQDPIRLSLTRMPEVAAIGDRAIVHTHELGQQLSTQYLIAALDLDKRRLTVEISPDRQVSFDFCKCSLSNPWQNL